MKTENYLLLYAAATPQHISRVPLYVADDESGRYHFIADMQSPPDVHILVDNEESCLYLNGNARLEIRDRHDAPIPEHILRTIWWP